MKSRLKLIFIGGNALEVKNNETLLKIWFKFDSLTLNNKVTALSTCDIIISANHIHNSCEIR